MIRRFDDLPVINLVARLIALATLIIFGFDARIQ
jgi:hypothetical protein